MTRSVDPLRLRDALPSFTDIPFGNRTREGTANRSALVGTGDAHGDFLSRQIVRGVRNRIRHGVTRIKILNRALIQRVRPGSTGSHEATIGIITTRGRLIIERGTIIVIHIADR